MELNLRVKPYYHFLQRGEFVELIKTLDEGIKVPAGKLFDEFLLSIQKHNSKTEILNEWCLWCNIPIESAELLLGKFLEWGIVEWYVDESSNAVNRFNRQLLLFDALFPQTNFGAVLEMQEQLSQTHILILGIGGIGNFIAMSLVAAGIGEITLVDFDVIEESNLNRQILFTETDIGKQKTIAAKERLRLLNSNCKINTIETKINSVDDLSELIQKNRLPQYIVLSADHPPELVLWASTISHRFQFKYIKCGYMAYQGLIGPLLGPETKKYEELFESWGNEIKNQPEPIQKQNLSFLAASSAPTNAILANIAAWELIKDIVYPGSSVLVEKRLLFNLKTMEMVFG